VRRSHDPAARAETVIVGIQPEVAFAMGISELTLEGVATALDLEERAGVLGTEFQNHETEVIVVSSRRNSGGKSIPTQDIVSSAKRGGLLRTSLGFSLRLTPTLIATGVSEPGRTSCPMPDPGEIKLKGSRIKWSRTWSFASDPGPGILDIRPGFERRLFHCGKKIKKKA